MRKAGWLIGVLLWTATGVCGQTEESVAQEPSIDLPPPLKRVLTDYESAWSRRDARALALLFADDGFVLANGHPPLRGRAAIECYYQGHGGPLALRAIAFGEEDSVGFILGGYTSERGKPDDGKFTLSLRKNRNGRWLIYRAAKNGAWRFAARSSRGRIF